MKGTIHFKTNEAACLFESEITGQLSDGMWENTRPDGHWCFWNEADIKVDGQCFTEGWPMKRNYNLHALTKYVKEEMKDAIRFARSRYFKLDLIEFKRMLTNQFYIGSDYTPWHEDAEETDGEFLKKHASTVDFKANDALKKIGNPDEISEEFKRSLLEEVIRLIRAQEARRLASLREIKEKQKKRLAEAGIIEENYIAVMKDIKSIEVTDAELKQVLDEIMAAMRNSK